jgi:hypothetical protein
MDKLNDPDPKMSMTCNSRSRKSIRGTIFYSSKTTPNLVQHRTEPSTWEGQPHTSDLFDPDWKF